MQKTRTRGTGIRRGLRQGIALFFGVVGLWLLWLTGDPRAALANWVGERDLAAALLAVELPMPGDGDGLGLWERLMVGQSPLPVPPAEGTGSGQCAARGDGDAAVPALPGGCAHRGTGAQRHAGALHHRP